MAREVDRHRDQVQAQVSAVVGFIVAREADRLLSVAIAPTPSSRVPPGPFHSRGTTLPRKLAR